MDPTRIALLSAVALFLLFVIVKLRFPLFADPAMVDARKKMIDAKKRAREQSGAERARAWRQAADIALEDLGRPNLAASYARRAYRADPDDGESLAVVSRAMIRARRYGALEKLLWRRLAKDPTPERREHLFAELLRLYDGPMRRPSQAKVIRELIEA